MAKDASKGSGGGGKALTADEKKIQKLEQLRNMDGGHRADMRKVLDSMPDGTVITTFRDNDGAVENEEVWTKHGDSWDKGKFTSLTTSGFIRKIAPMDTVAPSIASGEVDTSSHVHVTGKAGRPIEGLKYADGTYDLQVRTRNRLARKIETSGKLTTYDGVQYGVEKKGGTYTVTHVPSGLAVASDIKSMKGVSEAIKKNAPVIKSNSRDGGLIDTATKKFKNMMRGTPSMRP